MNSHTKLRARCARVLNISFFKLRSKNVSNDAQLNQIFLDVSELCQRDSGTGIQRVVRSYALELITNPPPGFEVKLVYATKSRSYRQALRFTQKLFGKPFRLNLDRKLKVNRGDIFFGLDLQHSIQLKQENFYSGLQQNGVAVYFMIYDLLPIEFPEYFGERLPKVLHESILRMYSKFDGVVCISESTADSFVKWLEVNDILLAPDFKLNSVHLGSDIENFIGSTGLPRKSYLYLEKLTTKVSFVSVSTLEPRKGQLQILRAFETIWNCGFDVNLFFVGKLGWNMDEFAELILKHPELNERLFWLKDVSDEFLQEIYRSSSCLIVASYAEGFCLPLIEAAQFDLPVIARDIPVHREVAGEFVTYFNTRNSWELSEVIQRWLRLYNTDQHPRSGGMPRLTWKESSTKLSRALTS
jgi:glycosyltransferase involved in cell wall biosynthesis